MDSQTRRMPTSQTSDEARKRAVNALITRLIETMDDPIPHMEVREEVQNAMLKPPIAIQEEHTAPVFIQEGTQPRDMDHGNHHSKPRDEGSITHSLDSDAASRRRRERRSLSPPTRKRSPTYPPPNDANMGDNKDKKR